MAKHRPGLCMIGEKFNELETHLQMYFHRRDVRFSREIKELFANSKAEMDGLSERIATIEKKVHNPEG